MGSLGVLQNPAWGLQLDWWIDAVNGNDRNTGDVVGAPIRTWREFSRRLKDVVIDPSTGLMTVHVLGAGTPASDEFSADLTLADGARVIILGVLANILHAGTLTGAVASNPAANTANRITDGALVWGPFVNKRIRMTAGPNQGAMGWIAKDLGAGAARASFPVTSDNITQAFPTVTASAYTTNTYVVESLPAIVFGAPAVRQAQSGIRPPGTFFPFLIFDNLAIEPAVPGAFESAFIDADGSNIAFTNCEMPTGMGIGGSLASLVQNCAVGCSASTFVANGLYAVGSSRLEVDAGLFFTSFAGEFEGSLGDSEIIYDFEVLFQGLSLVSTDLAPLRLAGVAVFDAPGTALPSLAAIHVGNAQVLGEQGGRINISSATFGTAVVYGSGNAGVGLVVSAGGEAYYDTGATLAITGTGGDFRVGQAGLALPNLDSATGLPGAAVNQTWNDLAAALPGGFGGLARNLANNAQIAVNA